MSEDAILNNTSEKQINKTLNDKRKKLDRKLKREYEKENAQDAEYKKYILEKIDEYNNNGKRTIVYFCDTFYPLIDGVIKVLDNYATRLNGKYNVVVVIPKHKNIVVKKDYLVIGTMSMYFKFVNYDLAFPDVDGFLAKAMKKLRIDIIHSHSPVSMGAYAARLAKRRKVPFIMHMHSQYKLDFMKHTNSEVLTNYLVDQILKVFNKSTEVWTMHNKIRDCLIDYGYKGKFYLIPNATEMTVPGNIEELTKQLEKTYKISKNEHVLLFVGRIVELKNIFFTASVLKILKQKGFKFKMFFVGDGPDEAELKERIKEYGLDDNVIFTGKVSDKDLLSSIYNRAELFVFPSVYDASSIVQIEAAAFKTPVIFIDGTVTAATVENKVNGFTAPNDVDKFADEILNIFKNKELLNEVSENAHRDLYVKWEQVVDMIDKRYDYLIKQNNRKNKILSAIRNSQK